MMEASSAACEIARLSEDLLAAALSLTAPRDACRAAAVSPAFRAAADSDAVWSRFLADLPPLADEELQHAPPSKKELFIRLFDGPVLLADGLLSMWLDRDSGAKCYMLSARALNIVWGADLPHHWRWIPVTNSRFGEAIEFLEVSFKEISGKMDSRMLSPNTKYAAYMVLQVNEDDNFGLDAPPMRAVVTTAQDTDEREVFLLGYEEEDWPESIRTWMQLPNGLGGYGRSTHRGPPRFPKKRVDGRMKLEMGEFFNPGDDDDDGEVSISLVEMMDCFLKEGFIVHGIEIRVKKLNRDVDQRFL